MRFRDVLARATFGVACAAVLATGAGAKADGIEHELSGRFALESRWYPQSAAHAGQRSHATGFIAESTLHLENEEAEALP